MSIEDNTLSFKISNFTLPRVEMLTSKLKVGQRLARL